MQWQFGGDFRVVECWGIGHYSLGQGEFDERCEIPMVQAQLLPGVVPATVLSCTAGIRAEPGDVFGIQAAPGGAPLRNPLALAPDEGMRRVLVL